MHTDRPMLRLYLLLFLCLFAAGIPAGAQFPYVVEDTDGIPPALYRERRERLADMLGPRTLMAVAAADVRNRQNDVDYEYRQNSDLLYLTGMPHRGATLLLSHGGIRVGQRRFRHILFVRPRQPASEVWYGVEMGPAEAAQHLGLDTVLPVSDLQAVLRAALADTDTLLLPSMPTKSLTVPLVPAVVYADNELRKMLADDFPRLKVVVRNDLVAGMRVVKDTAELRLMRKAIDISIQGHLAAMRGTRPGMHEYEIEALMEYMFHRHGAEDVGYPSIVGSEYKACILHSINNRRQTVIGDLVLADCGAEYHGYTADITRTFPVNGRFTADQRRLYDIVLEAQDSGIAACRPGAAFRAPHEAAFRVIARHLQTLGIAADSVAVTRYFMHGTSHYLGLDVHDPGPRVSLRPGTVLTVEPGIYIPAGSPCDPRWWNIGIRIEDDILVTDGAPDNLSVALPRAAADIEALVGTAP